MESPVQTVCEHADKISEFFGQDFRFVLSIKTVYLPCNYLLKFIKIQKIKIFIK